jgi:hypothetical protein
VKRSYSLNLPAPSKGRASLFPAIYRRVRALACLLLKDDYWPPSSDSKVVLVSEIGVRLLRERRVTLLFREGGTVDLAMASDLSSGREFISEAMVRIQ